jgi:hypothetical protein
MDFAHDTQSDVQSGAPFSAATADVNNFLIKGPSAATNVRETAPGVFTVHDNPVQRQKSYLVMEEFVWNPTDTAALDRAGSFGIFTIAPTIKPRGGYFTRPEIVCSPLSRSGAIL